MGGHDAGETVEAHRVGAVQQLWGVLSAIEGACPCQNYSEKCCSIASSVGTAHRLTAAAAAVPVHQPAKPRSVRPKCLLCVCVNLLNFTLLNPYK